MQVIFCNMPSKTTLHELATFARSGVRSVLSISRKEHIIGYEILDVLDKTDHHQEFHGIVTFASPAAGQKAIKALNGKKLHGKPLLVREYRYRSPGDQRVRKQSQGLNRPTDRRRDEIVVKKRSEQQTNRPVITAYGTARTYGK